MYRFLLVSPISKNETSTIELYIRGEKMNFIKITVFKNAVTIKINFVFFEMEFVLLEK